MIQRITTLTSYLLRRTVFSLSGGLFILLTFGVWIVFFDPRQRTPEADYYILVIAVFGSAMGFLTTINIAGRANHAMNYPLLARLPSRVEHLTAVLLTGVICTVALQILLAILSLWGGPELTLGRLIEIPPIWLSLDILLAVMALHASDLVVKGWSRVYVYGLTAVFLFGQNVSGTSVDWLTTRVNRLSSWLFQRNLQSVGNFVNDIGNWLGESGTDAVPQLLGIPFWPFRVISEATIAGFFTTIQALAPFILLLYATILFMLAADFFASKDLYLVE